MVMSDEMIENAMKSDKLVVGEKKRKQFAKERIGNPNDFLRESTK